MNNRQDGIFALVSAVLVLLSALIHPLVAAILAAVLFVGFAVYKFRKR